HDSVVCDSRSHYSKIGESHINIQSIIQFYQDRAKEGNVYAQYILGLYYENGIGVEADMHRAVELYERAAEQGYAKARSKVYTFHENGSEVKKKIREKIELYNTVQKRKNS